MNFSTKAIHEGQKPDPTTGAIIPPLYLTSTYVQEAPGVYKGYDYTRAGNPNFTNLEETLAALEGGKYATVFSSGLGATTALGSILKSGDLVIAGNDLYGGTYRLFTTIFNNYGIKFKLINLSDETELTEALAEKPRMLLVETPTNPLLKITDLKKVLGAAKSAGVFTIVDNTFATPYFQKPLELGADAILHSTTKYIGGHSDIIGGALISNSEEFKTQMDFARKAMGLNPSPFDAWLASRGLKTLAVRMEKHQSNAFAIARFLETHPLVKKVYYPGLESHEGHEIAASQMSGFGGVVSVEFNLSLEQMKQLISSFNVFSLAESLGGVESLVDHPASMTHASIPAEERAKIGLSDGLVRISVGIEDEDDLLEDLKNELAKFG